jgi:hypothetical protein
MKLTKSKLYPLFIIILTIAYAYVINSKNGEDTSNQDLNAFSSHKDFEKGVTIQISINKEKEIRINESLIPQSEITNEINRILKNSNLDSDSNGITFNFYVENSVSKGYFTDIVENIYSKLDSKTSVRRKLCTF